MAAALILSINLTAHADNKEFSDYREFYRALGSNIFPDKALPLSMPCTESPRHCIWANSMQAAMERYDQDLWTVPDNLPTKPSAGNTNISFEGTSIRVGNQSWRLHDAIRLSPDSEHIVSTMDPEALKSISYWHSKNSTCLELQYSSSGRDDRHTGVLLIYKRNLYILPSLFASCMSIRQDGKVFSYPSNSYIGPAESPTGLRVDYLRLNEKIAFKHFKLNFADPENPFKFIMQND